MKKALITLTLVGSSIIATTLSARPGEGRRPGPPDPDTVVVELMTNYDSDENNSLSQDELVAGLKGFHEQRMAARQANRPNKDRKPPEGAGRPKRGGPPVPEEIAPKLISDFDANGDASLDTAELLKAVEFMQSRQMRDRPGPRPDSAE